MPKGYIIGVSVSDEVWVVRDGKKVVIERYKNGKKIWDRRSSGPEGELGGHSRSPVQKAS